MELQEKEPQTIKAYMKSPSKEPTVTRCLFILELHTLTSLVKEKHYKGREFQCQSCAKRETLDIGILVISRNGDGKIMQSIKITSRLPLRKR